MIDRKTLPKTSGSRIYLATSYSFSLPQGSFMEYKTNLLSDPLHSLNFLNCTDRFSQPLFVQSNLTPIKIYSQHHSCSVWISGVPQTYVRASKYGYNSSIHIWMLWNSGINIEPSHLLIHICPYGSSSYNFLLWSSSCNFNLQYNALRGELTLMS